MLHEEDKIWFARAKCVDPKADLRDLLSHRSAWRSALERMKAQANGPHDEADLTYWTHELEVFDRTMDAAVAVMVATKMPGFTEGS